MKGKYKFLKRFLFSILLIAALIACFQYFYCPVYDFPEPKPFWGDNVYNPYEGMDSTAWKKANLHAHTRRWGGITDGRQNSELAVDSMYRYLYYDIIGISDYQSINHYRDKEKDYIPEYEHGYLPPKNHQVVLNAKKVVWFDYPFPQTLNNKQYIIQTLRSDSSVILSIAHPNMQEAYPVKDFRYLTGYDCIEVFDRMLYSIPQWDAALSSGHPAFATSVDDTHDVHTIGGVGFNFTLVNTPDVKADSVLHALKNGRMIACGMALQWQHEFSQKRSVSESIPIINNVTFEDTALTISANTVMLFVKFIGQGGRVKKIVNNSMLAVYDFKPEDTYIRTEIHFPGATIYYLNPVFRYYGDKPYKPEAKMNEASTFVRRLVLLQSIGVLVLIIIYYKMRTRTKNRQVV